MPKRQIPSNFVVSDEGSSASYPDISARGSSAGSARRKNKRVKLNRSVDSSQSVMDFIQRYNLMDYLGNLGFYSGLDDHVMLAEPDSHVLSYLDMKAFPVQNFNLSDWCMVLPNSVVELNHLDLFNRVPSVLPRQFMDVIVKATTHVAGLLALPGRLSFPSISELENVHFYGDRFPGVEYAKAGFKTRSDANDIAQLDAETAYVDLRQGLEVSPHLVRMGGRGKLTTRAKLAAAGDKPIVGRLILMTSQRDLKINGLTEQALTTCYCNDRYPISVGTSWWHGGSETFLRRFKEFDRYWCFDASKYDASLPGWLVQFAIEILRDQYEDGLSNRFDAYWTFIYDGLVRGKVFIDNGLTFQRKLGTTSGHSHNTLIQSICTLIVGYASILSLYESERWDEVLNLVWFESLGDDQLGAGRGICGDLALEEIARMARLIFGIDWFGEKSFSTGRLVDDQPYQFQGVQFLGKYWRTISEIVQGRKFQGIIPYRPNEETLLRLVYPERRNTGLPLESYARAVGHYMDAAGNPEVREWLEGYLDYLEPMLPVAEFEWDKSFSRKYQGAFDSMESLPKGRRYSYLNGYV